MSAKNNSFIRLKSKSSLRKKGDSNKNMKIISWYYKLTESVLNNYIKMPSTPYDLVKDDQDLRIPLHAEQAFFHGITFQAKVNFKILFKFKLIRRS